MDGTQCDLLDRLEQQAVRIADLERENASLREQLDGLPLQVERSVLRRMANGAVNCGPHSGCCLAGRMLAIREDES